MQKKVLSEIALYYGDVTMPKGWDIDRDKLQDDMVYVKDKLSEHEKLLQLNPKFRVRTASESFSVSGSIRSNGINT